MVRFPVPHTRHRSKKSFVLLLATSHPRRKVLAGQPVSEDWVEISRQKFAGSLQYTIFWRVVIQRQGRLGSGWHRHWDGYSGIMGAFSLGQGEWMPSLDVSGVLVFIFG